MFKHAQRAQTDFKTKIDATVQAAAPPARGFSHGGLWVLIWCHWFLELGTYQICRIWIRRALNLPSRQLDSKLGGGVALRCRARAGFSRRSRENPVAMCGFGPASRRGSMGEWI